MNKTETNPKKQKSDSSEKLVKQNANSITNKTDVNVLKDQNKETKDSDHKNENAANAKNNAGHFKSPKKPA